MTVPLPRRPHPPLGLPLLAERARALLVGGVPLTLLLDLAEPAGPASRALYEGEAPDLAWLDER